VLEPTPATAAAIGALLALWLGGAIWALVTGLRLRERAQAAERRSHQLQSLLAAAPALIMLVHKNGRIEASERLADWLGLNARPTSLNELRDGACGLSAADLAALEEDVRSAQAAGRSFYRMVQPEDSPRSLTLRGGPAPTGVAGSGTVVIYVFDATDIRAEMTRLADEAERLKIAFGALSGLIEASPIPMWHRGPDLDVIARGLELVEAGPDRNPIAAAAAAREGGQTSSRVLPATVGGERRNLRVVDVPLGHTGVAGYAIDVEELEQARAAFKQFAEAQRDMLDRLSAGVAQAELL
jgi:PAS domain-containing protein